MPVSNYMPAITVEIAFDGGFRIPMADWTWTDVSDYVELKDNVNGAWGRQDERSNADANTLHLTLDNSDGRFTAARSTSPYYPNVVLYKPIRVLVDPVDGTESSLFTGYVTSWPVEWEDTSAYAKATVTATSRLARLGLNARWRSIVEETILAAGPAIYYPLSDPQGSAVASDASGNGAAPLVMVGNGDDVVFGQATGPGTDGLTAATFAGGKYLSAQTTEIVPADGDYSVVTYLNVSGAPSLGSEATVLDLSPVTPTSSTDRVVLQMQTTGSLVTLGPASIGGGDFNDGATHCVILTWSPGELRLYVDGALLDDDLAAAATHSAFTTLNVGGGQSGQPLIGVLAHTAVLPVELTAGQVTSIFTAGDDAWAGETTAARFERYAAMAGIPTAEVNAEAGSTSMVHVDTTDQNVVDLLRLVETTEAGVLFDALDGTLTLHGRAHRYTTASALTLDMAKHEVEADYSPRLDPTGLANDITATGVTSAYIVDDGSRDAYGVATASISTASEDVNEPLSLASWTRYKCAEPKPRVPSLSVDVTNQAAFFAEGQSTVSSAALLALTIGDRITVANHPQQAALSITDYFIEGGSFTIGPESFRITWNVSPTDAEDQVLILDDPVRGLLDTNVFAL